MVQEQDRVYDKNAERLSLRWAVETGTSSYQHRLDGIQRDIESFQNEQTNAFAYWSGTYELGVDGHGKSALVTSEIAIPGRAHRTDSHAMVDSMAGNAVYVLDQIEKGNMAHDEWDTAREQLKQFRAVQEAALLLQNGESLLGFAMNGQTTRDGIALMQITRQQNIFHYETRLLGGLSEGAVHDILKKYTSDSAKHIFLNEKTENPLYMAVKGKISINLKNQQETIAVVQEVLDARKETLTALVSIGTCRSKEAQPESDNKKIKQQDSFIIKKQHEYAIGLMHKKRIDDVPYDYTSFGLQPPNVSPLVSPARSWVVFESEKITKQITEENETVPTKRDDIVVKEVQKKLLGDMNKEVVFSDVSREVTPLTLQQQKSEESEKDAVFISAPFEQRVTKTHVEMPLATCVIKTESLPLSQYMEKALTITLSVDAQLFDEETDDVHEVMSDQIALHVPHVRREQEMSVEQSNVREVCVEESKHPVVEKGSYVAVDQINLQDMQAFVADFEKQVKAGTVKGEVKKLVWMEINDQSELVPVEELEIVKDTSKTVHNLLHFLRKVIRVYGGNDVIRERGIKRIVSDTFQDELKELEEYIHVLQASRFHGHMFAMVS